nr:immunoglobulin heavy chain junction region [Mus musculus]
CARSLYYSNYEGFAYW